MTLQELGPRAARFALVVVLTCAALGALAVGALAWHYTRPPTPEGSPA